MRQCDILLGFSLGFFFSRAAGVRGNDPSLREAKQAGKSDYLLISV